MRLKLEVFWSPKLLEDGSIFKAKVSVRLKLESSLIWRFYGAVKVSITTIG